MTDIVKVLSDDDLREIEARVKNAYAKWHTPGYVKQILDTDIPALCATARALREKYDSLKSKIPWHRDGVGPDVPVSQERYDRLMAQRTVLTTGLANIYHVITDEECDRAVVLGMATSAVSSLLNQNTALREQLAQLSEVRDQLRDKAGGLQSQLAQVTQERDRLQEQLAEEVAKRVNSNVERMEQSQKVVQAELERHCSDDRLTDTQRGSYQD